MLKSLVPDDVKVNTTNDDIRLRSNSTANETTRFTNKNLFSVQYSVVLDHAWGIK